MSFGGSLGSAQGELLIDIQQALANLTTLENRVKGLNGVGGDALTGLESGAGGRLDRTTNKLNNFSKGAQILGKAGLGAGIAVAAGFGLAVNSAANFEQSMSFVSAALGGVGGDAGITKDQFQALSDEALNIGATTSVSAGEAAQAMELLGKAGLDATDILQGGARAVVDISQATGESIQQSAASFGALQNLFADTGISAADMADAIVVGMNSSNATLSEFQTGISRLAPVIAQTGLSFNDSAAAIAYFNSRGLSAAEVGTSLTAAFNNLANPTAEAATAMQDLGIAAFDSQGNFVGFPKIMDDVAAATAGMSDEQRNAVLSTIFGADAMDLMADSAKTGGDGLRDLTEKTKEQGIAAKQSAERMNNFKGAIETFKGAIGSLAIAIGTPLLGPLRAITEALARMVEMFLKLPKGVQTAIAAIVAIAGAIAGVLGAIVVFGPSIAAVLALFAEGGMLAGVGATIGALAVPILLVVAALALLGLAYKTNFLGFADAVNGVAGAVASKLTAAAKGIAHFASQVGAAFGAFRGAGQNPVAAAFNAIGLELEAVAGKFGPFSGLVKNTAKDFRALGSAAQQGGKILKGVQATYRDLVKNGMSPVAAGLKALGAAFIGNSSLFGRFAPVAEGVGRALSVAGDFTESFANRFKQLFGTMDTGQAIFQALGDAVTNIAGHFGPLEGAVLKVGDALRSIGEAVGDFIDAGQAILGGDYSEAWDELKSAVGNVGSAIKDFGGAATSALGAAWDALSGVDWGGVLDTIGSGLSTLGDLALQGLGSLSDQLQTWLNDAAAWASTYDWGALVDGATNLAGRAFEKAGELASAAANWITDAVVATIPYWDDLLDGAVGLAEKAFDKAGDLAGAVANWITAAIVASIGYWPNILDGAKELAGKFIGLAGDLAGSVANWITAAVVAAIGYWPNILDGAKELAGKFVGLAGDLAGSVANWITAAVVAAIGYWPNILDGAKDLAGKFIGLAGDLASSIANWITAAIVAATGYWPNILDGAKDLAGKFIGIAGDLGGKVVSWVTSAIAAVSNYWPNIIDGAKDLAGKAITAAGDLASKFTEWGQAAIDAVTNLPWSDMFSGLMGAISTAVSAAGSLFSGLKAGLGIGGGGDKEGGDTGAQILNAEAAATALTNAQATIAAAGQAIINTLSQVEIAFDGFVTKAGLAGSAAGTAFSGAVATGFQPAYNSIQSIIASTQTILGAWVAQMGAFGTGGGTLFSTNLSTGLTTAQTAVTTATSAMQVSMGNFAAQAGAFGTSAGNQFRANLTNGMNAARAAVQSAAAAMTATLNQLASAAGQAGSQGGQSFARGIQQGMSAATSAAQSGRSSIISAMTLPDMSGVGYSAGASLGQGVANGINSALGAVQAAANAIIATAASAMAAAAQIHSPSKLTAKYGRWWTEGFVIGVDRGTPDAVEAVAKLIPTRPIDTMMAFGDRPVSSSSATSITNVFALKSEELVRLMRDAETGGAYARETTFLLGAH